MATKKKPSERKYGAAAGKQVETEMREFKQGKLKSGRSGKKVTNPKQAIAIGLSEARRKGAKVPREKSWRRRSWGSASEWRFLQAVRRTRECARSAR